MGSSETSWRFTPHLLTRAQRHVRGSSSMRTPDKVTWTSSCDDASQLRGQRLSCPPCQSAVKTGSCLSRLQTFTPMPTRQKLRADHTLVWGGFESQNVCGEGKSPAWHMCRRPSEANNEHLRWSFEMFRMQTFVYRCLWTEMVLLMFPVSKFVDLSAAPLPLKSRAFL